MRGKAWGTSYHLEVPERHCRTLNFAVIVLSGAFGPRTSASSLRASQGVCDEWMQHHSVVARLDEFCSQELWKDDFSLDLGERCLGLGLCCQLLEKAGLAYFESCRCGLCSPGEIGGVQ